MEINQTDVTIAAQSVQSESSQADGPITE